ncbi:unnamed protein product, partial [Phaeothamnion confervicola]
MIFTSGDGAACCLSASHHVFVFRILPHILAYRLGRWRRRRRLELRLHNFTLPGLGRAGVTNRLWAARWGCVHRPGQNAASGPLPVA